MAEITQTTNVSIENMLSRLEEFKYNPAGLQRAIFSVLDEITDGEIDIVDPTNPFVFLLEASSVNTALAVSENLINLRKQYPSLAQTEDELYPHMADVDFINRFAIPSETSFTVTILVDDLLNKLALIENSDNIHQATIAKNTEFVIDGVTFSLQYPINIRRFSNGVLQISYDTSEVSPLETLTTNIIDYQVRTDSEHTDWIFFEVPVKQFSILSSHFVLQQSSIFVKDIPFDNQYYYCRVWTKNNGTSNNWIEVRTTHTDQVYDPFTPTVVLKVTEGNLNVFVPNVYVANGLISGDLRIDLYTTLGPLTMNLANYKILSFETRLKAVDEENDLDIHTTAMSDLNYYSYSTELVNGGLLSKSFNDIRERVIFNSIDTRQLPITNVQISAYVNDKGFDLVRNVDVVTNRIFLATRTLPKPIDRKIITSANIGITTIVTKADTLRSLEKVIDNGDRFTILSNNLFISENGIIRFLSDVETASLNSLNKSLLVSEINSKGYLYSPFYYVLDNSSTEFKVRAYNLDAPVAKNLNFKTQNQSLQLVVNTGSYAVSKIATGYKLTIVAKSGNFYKQLADNQVALQLAYYPNSSSTLAYINAVQLGTDDDGERVFEILIESSHDIDSDDLLHITNSKMFSDQIIVTDVELTSNFNLLYTTNSITNDFESDDSNNMIGDFLLPVSSAVITRESIDIVLGTALSNLWTRSRSRPSGLDYQQHSIDVPLLYEHVVYNEDPSTGSIFTIDGGGSLVYNILHNIGDPVLDGNNVPLYKYRIGDPVLDVNGDPVLLNSLEIEKEYDLLFVDGKYYFSDDVSFKSYRNELRDIIDTWVNNDLKDIQSLLLEQTKIFLFPSTTIGKVKVKADNLPERLIDSEQSFSVNLFVNRSVYDDDLIRDSITLSTSVFIDNYINSNNLINMTDLLSGLRDIYNDSVVSFNVNGLGGNDNFNVISVTNEHNGLSLKKKLELQQDNSIIVVEDIEVSFRLLTT